MVREFIEVKYNKEETFEYFNKQKTATIKETSLLNFIKNDTKNNNIKKLKKIIKNEQKDKQKKKCLLSLK